MTINNDAKEYGKKFLENEFQYLEISNGSIERLVEKSYKAGAEAERQKCIEVLNGIDGKTEYESLWFMEHILERIRTREEARAKFGGSKELPPREMIWEGINYYKEQAIAQLSEEVD